MNEEQRELIALLMKGYTLNDIAELRQQEWRQIERGFVTRYHPSCEKIIAAGKKVTRMPRENSDERGCIIWGEEEFSRKTLLLWIRREKVLQAGCNVRGEEAWRRDMASHSPTA